MKRPRPKETHSYHVLKLTMGPELCWPHVVQYFIESSGRHYFNPSSIDRWGNWGSEGQSDLPNVPELISGGIRIWTQVSLLQSTSPQPAHPVEGLAARKDALPCTWLPPQTCRQRRPCLLRGPPSCTQVQPSLELARNCSSQYWWLFSEVWNKCKTGYFE